jgi:hypothetical protein
VSVLLSLPCRVITLNVMTGPARAGTTLEGLVAEAIRLEHDTTRDLARFFALPEVVIGDVVHTLWNGGWVWMDFDSGRIGLTDRAQERDWDPANHPAARTDRREYLYEPLSRLVFAQKQSRQRPHRDYVEVPADVEGGGPLADASPTELRAAVQRLVHEEQDSSYNSVVLSVLPAARGEGQEGALRWVPLQATVATSDGRLRLQAVDTSGPWTTPAVARLSARIADYVVRWPASKFSNQILGQATLSLQRTPSAETLLERMAEDIKDTVKQDKVAAWEGRQVRLRDSALRLHQYLDSVNQMRAPADLLTTEAALSAAVRTIVASARQQVLVVSARFSQLSLHALLDAGVEEALSRGCQLVLIWGTRPDDTLAGPVLAQLEAWRHAFPEQVLVPASSARTDAHVIVADDHTALVGSGNLLASAGFEAAALLVRSSDTSLPSSASSLLPSPTPPSARPQAVLELLAWARSRCPDWLLGQAILTPAELAPRRREVMPSAETPQLPALPEGRDTSMIPVWRASWSEYRAMLSQSVRALAEGLPVVEVLQDGEIHDVIADRVKQVTWRLAVADDTTRSRPLREPLLDDVEECSRKIVVRVDCSDPSDGLDDNSPLSRLPRIGRAGPARGRVFLADHQVILGSATPLTTPTGQVAARRTQVGVRVHNRQLADEAAEWLGLPALEGPLQPAAGEPAPHGARDALALAEGALVAVRESTPLDEYLDQELGDHPEPWSLLDHLLESLNDPVVPTAAVATVLRRADLPDEQRARWSRWLVGHLWERNEFVAAALIGGSRPDDARAISPDGCLLAAAVEHTPLPVDLLPPTVSLADRPGSWEATAAARLAGVSGLLAQYLLGADTTAKECVLLLLDSLPAAWQELTSTAVGIYRETGALLPVAEAARAVSQDAEHLSERARWSLVKEKTDKLLGLHNRFDDFVSGSVMYQRITANDGLLTRLHHAATTDDQDLRRDVVAGLPTKIRPYLDDIVKQSGKERIAWSDHRSFLEKVEEVMRMARAAAKVQRSADGLSVRPADIEFVGWLRERWDSLETAAAELPAPYQHPPLALLNRLRPLLVWRETQS